MKLTEKQLNQLKYFLKVKNGRTIKEAASKLGISPVTTRKYVATLVADGSIHVIGKALTDQRGRPATMYATSDSTEVPVQETPSPETPAAI